MQTLRVWDRAGKIRTIRTDGGQRRVPQSEIDRLTGTDDLKRTVTLAYCRVSTKNQKDNLERQVGRVLEYCAANGWQVELYKEIASGLNEHRPQFKKLLKRIAEGDVARVVVEFRDRIARFGLQMFTEYCDKFGVELVIMKQGETKEFEQEMVDDIVMIMSSYSARLYGRRGGKKKKANQTCAA